MESNKKVATVPKDGAFVVFDDRMLMSLKHYLGDVDYLTLMVVLRWRAPPVMCLMPDEMAYNVNHNKLAYFIINEAYRDDKYTMKKVVHAQPICLAYLDDIFRDDEEMVFTALLRDHGCRLLHFASERIKSDKNTYSWMAGIQTCGFEGDEIGRILNKYQPSLCDDKEFMQMMICKTRDADLFSHASERLRDDKDIVILCMTRLHHLGRNFVKKIGPRCRNSIEIMLMLLDKVDDSVEYCGKKLKDNKDFAFVIGRKYMNEFCSLSKRLRSDRSFVLDIMKYHRFSGEYDVTYYILHYMGDNLKNDVTFAHELLEVHDDLKKEIITRFNKKVRNNRSIREILKKK